MVTLPDSFMMSLAEFGKRLGADLAFQGGRCNFTVDGAVEVELDYDEEAQVVIAWATVGYAPQDEWQGERARALLAWNELDADNGGFSLAMDPETRIVVAHDNRPAELFDSEDRLAAWIGALTELVERIRVDFGRRFPCNDFVEEM